MSLTRTTAKTVRRVALGLLAVGVLILALMTAYRITEGPPRLEITAEFASTSGVFEGSQVRMVGVTVGRVENVEPAGDIVRVVMSFDPDVALPRDAMALVMTPAAVSDRFVEISPAYEGGQALESGDVIPVERTRAPLEFENFARNLNTISESLAPSSDEAASALSKGAESVEGMGPELNQAIRDLNSVTRVTGDRSGDMQQIAEDLTVMLRAVGGQDESLSELIDALDGASETITAGQTDYGVATRELAQLLRDIDRFVEDNGLDLTESTSATLVTTEMLANHEDDLAEIMDLYPLMMSNFPRGIGGDGRARIRLNISTDLASFAKGEEFCSHQPLPICAGAGISNPVSLPLSRTDPLSFIGQLDEAMRSGS